MREWTECRVHGGLEQRGWPEEAGRRPLPQWSANNSPEQGAGNSLRSSGRRSLQSHAAAGRRPRLALRPHLTPAWPYPLRRRPASPFPRGGFGRSQGCLSTNAGRETPEALMPPPVFSVGPEGRGLGSRPSCLEWRPARGRGWPRPATSSSSPSPPRAHSRVSLPPLPLPLPRAPRAGGSRRPGDGRVIINPRPEIPPEGPGRAAGARGGPARSLAGRPRLPPPPSPLSPPPASWKLGRQPTPSLRSAFQPRGAGWARAARPRRASGWGRSQCLRSGDQRRLPTPNGARPLSVREAGGTRDTPSDSLSSGRGLSPTAPTPALGCYSLSARGVTRGCAPCRVPTPDAGFSPLRILRGGHLEAHFSGEGSEVHGREGLGARAGQEPDRLLRGAPRTAQGGSGLSHASGGPLPGA